MMQKNGGPLRMSKNGAMRAETTARNIERELANPRFDARQTSHVHILPAQQPLNGHFPDFQN
jgi:hypothetical protein